MNKLPPHITKFRLGLYANAPGDARSLSRLLGPFQLMARQDRRLELVTPNRTTDNAGWDLDWHFFSACDAVIMLDPYLDADLRRIQLARACGCAVWADYVDDLSAVRPSNPVYMSYADVKGVQKNIAEVLRQSSITTTTTETLRQRLPFSDSVLVIPESCRWPASDVKRQRVVTWRGFGSHGEDLESVLPQVREVARHPNLSKFEWAFLGEPLWKVFDDVVPPERMVYAPPTTPYDLMNRWAGIAPYVHIVPLAANQFNYSKTPLAWLEATAIGAAVLAPEFPEWKGLPGLTTYRTPEEFGAKLRGLMESYDEGKLHPNVAESRKAIYPGWTTEFVNELRWGVLGELAKGIGKMSNVQCPMSNGVQKAEEVAA